MNTTLQDWWHDSTFAEKASLVVGIPLVLALIAALAFGGLWGTDDSSTRLYLLSTIAQTVGAVFGVSVTLILVTVQLTAEHYSARALELVLDDRWIVGFLLLNIATIVSSLVFLGNDHMVVVQNDWLAHLDEQSVVVLAGTALSAVPFALVRVLRLLSRVGIAHKLARRINLQAIKHHRDRHSKNARRLKVLQEPEESEDPFVPFADLYRTAIEKGHYASASKVLMVLVRRVEALIQDAKKTEPQALRDGVLLVAYDHLCTHLERMLSETPGPAALAVTLPVEYMAVVLMAHRRNALPKVEVAERRLVLLCQRLPGHFSRQILDVLTELGPTAVAEKNRDLARAVAALIEQKRWVDDAALLLGPNATQRTDEGDLACREYRTFFIMLTQKDPETGHLIDEEDL